MLSDRPYMRDDLEGRSPFSALTWLICAVLGGFVLENIFFRWFGDGAGQTLMNLVTLSPEGVSKGFLWTFLTHGLIHDPNQLLSLVLSLLMLFALGRIVLPQLGPKRFLGLVVTAIAAGGLAWLALNWAHADRLYGASAAIGALVVVFACLSPDQPISLFFINVGLKAKHLAFGWLVIELAGLFFMELPGRSSWFAMPHSAHLGGMLAGWLYFRWVHLRGPDWLASKSDVEPPRWFRKARANEATAPNKFTVNLNEPEDMRAEIDRILDKINSDGFQSLTPEEKHRLDLARDHLSRR